MQFGSFNYYKIKFFLDVLQTSAERLAYLKKLRKDVERIISCFTGQKVVPLRMYADDRVSLPDGCKELTTFIQNAIHTQSPFPNDTRMPGNEILKELVKKESLQYERLIDIIDLEIDHILKTGDPIGREVAPEVKKTVEKENSKIVNKQVYQEVNPDKVTNLLIEIDHKAQEYQAKRDELDLSSEKLRMVVELLIKEGFITKEKFRLTEKFINKYSNKAEPPQKNVANG